MADAPDKSRLRVTNPRTKGPFAFTVRVGIAVLIFGILSAGAGIVALYTTFASELPRLDNFDALVRPGVTRFEAGDGQLVGEWYQQRRIVLPWSDLPQGLILAFLAAEDARFFEHRGVDFRGVLRAMVENLRAGGIKQGASTITQQLAKTLVGNEKSYSRKVREAILARRIEDLYTKQQILTWYLNAIYLGHGSYGVQAAAQNYFRKDVAELTLGEMAMLGGLPQSPSRVNPAVNMTKALERRRHVLQQMQRRNWISQAAMEQALAQPVRVYPKRDTLGDHVPYYTEHVRKQVTKRYGGEGGSWLDRGLTVSMNVEPAHQRLASEALGRGLEDLAKRQGYPGPLGNLDRDTFLTRAAKYFPERGLVKGDRVLARVDKVYDRSVVCELSETKRGNIPLRRTKWAGSFTTTKGKRGVPQGKKGRVSFKPKLNDMRKAFKPGDIVLVEVVDSYPTTADLDLVAVPMMEGSVVSYPTVTGGIDVMVGGWDFDRSELNRAFSLRQTGSTMKPIVYSMAYDLGILPSAKFSGAPVKIGDYNPTGAKSGEDLMVWDALVHSNNGVSLQVLQEVLEQSSLEDYKGWGRALGLERELTGVPSEVLGGDQTAFSMARAYGTIALRGIEPSMELIRKVVDREGNVLERAIQPQDPHASFSDLILAAWDSRLKPRERKIPPGAAYVVSANLHEAVQSGTGKRAKNMHHTVGGKTGTLAYDVWFNGFSPVREAVVWVGSDRRERPLGRSTSLAGQVVLGGDTALPIWMDVMGGLDLGRPAVPLTERPPEAPADQAVNYLRVDPSTGRLTMRGGRTLPHIGLHIPEISETLSPEVKRIDDTIDSY